MNRSEFISHLAPYAVQLRLESSPIFPSVRLAQNLLETGGKLHAWNNLGGMKVGSGKPNEFWTGGVVYKGTWEVVDGQREDVTAAFRAYESIMHFYKDQDLLFQHPRYDRVRAALSPREQAEMLQASGYATDPQYAEKLITIMDNHGLYRYDEEAEQMEELKNEIEVLKRQVEQLQARASMEIPEWAQEAVAAAVAAGIVDTPDGGSYDFYRLLTVLHRKGLLSP